jgi:hypothetical protein
MEIIAPLLKCHMNFTTRRSDCLWRKAVTEWNTKHPGEIFNKVLFSPLLKQVTESSAKPKTLMNVCEAFGLYPLNPNALDYTKYLGVSDSVSLLNILK